MMRDLSTSLILNPSTLDEIDTSTNNDSIPDGTGKGGKSQVWSKYKSAEGGKGLYRLAKMGKDDRVYE